MGEQSVAAIESSGAALAQTLRITEIFLSIQGESVTSGRPTVFVRTTGCPLRCTYCDTAYAFTGGDVIALTTILDRVKDFAVDHVTVTGGEPLAQPATHALLEILCDQGYRVSLETSGAVDVSAVGSRVVKVVDIKTPGSSESARNLFANLGHLRAHDELKFVITDRADYEWSKRVLAGHAPAVEVLFSPSHDELDACDLAEWILADRLDVRLQIQLHKYLWGDEPGR